MNPRLVEAFVTLATEYFSGKPGDEEQYDNDIEAITEELREVTKERDNLRRQLSNARVAHEELHRALYPGLKCNLEK